MTPTEDPKRSRILDGAMTVLLAYGYQRTTMDDIARAADMSRPALYLLFKNKADIYSALAQRMFEDAIAHIDQVLAGPGPFADRVFAALDTVIIGMMQKISQSPHGAELLDLKNSLAGDLIKGWHTASITRFSIAITTEAQRAGVDLEARGLTANALAALLIDGLEGAKQRMTNADELRATLRQLIKVLELAVRP